MREASPNDHPPSRSDLEFRPLLERLPTAAYTCDAEGRITFFNERAAEMWGRTPNLNDANERFCGSYRMYSAEDGTLVPHELCWMARALAEGQSFNAKEIVVERSDGSRRTGLVHVDLLYDDAGRVTGAVNVVIDISERKLAEQGLRRADHQKDEFLAVLAHELRNPLAPIRNALHLLRMDGDNAVTVQQARTMMERQLHQLARLVDDLMDVSRVSQNRMVLHKERVELAAVLRTAIEETRPMFEAAELELIVSLPSQTIHVDGDVVRLGQVFSHLLQNAAKYTERGGRIWVTVEREGRDVSVKVRDTGVGIAPETLTRIFDTYRQPVQSGEPSHRGLGIGLSLARGLVEMHGGTISARSGGPGRGSVFIVRLPVLFAWKPQDAPATSEVDKSVGSLSSLKWRILVVDDEKDSAASWDMMLRLMGTENRTANDGLEAIERAEEFRPDVVLLDIGLPKLDGYEVARRIRHEPWGRLPYIIAITGWGGAEDRRLSAEAGFDLHLVKPVEPAALETVLGGLRRRVG